MVTTKHEVQTPHMPDPVLGLGLGPCLQGTSSLGVGQAFIAHSRKVRARMVKAQVPRDLSVESLPRPGETVVDGEIGRKLPEGNIYTEA